MKEQIRKYDLKKIHAIKKQNIPGCTYSMPQIASVGLTEEKALADGHKIKVDITFGNISKNDSDAVNDGVLTEKVIILNMHEDDRKYKCAIMLYNKKTHKANIRSLSNREYCALCKDCPLKIGNILVRILLKFCEENDIKEVTLLDNTNIIINKQHFSLY
jgi:hypothetical protein